MRYYYNERKNLLRCIATIYRFSVAGQPRFGAAADKEAKRLRTANHEAQMLNLLMNLTDASTFPKELVCLAAALAIILLSLLI